ncbi:F-box/LRR-repeat/kelch-repeat protein [Cardamine amara subsp. amara]|uniref:F-box/LRR-repeat/kelch-repeat protein n=1 Tax=Cardamine amara subsp. amara TaxID=228776 RepID=A0ABD1A9I5_CARAN
MMMLDLPCDLVEEILYRVPATSLSRLKFTCKLWNAFFKDPEFIKKHLDKAAKQNLVLMLSNFRVYSLSVNYLNEIQYPSIEITSKLSRSQNELEQISISQVFHCNGLLLCSTREANKTKLMIVNPYTGQTRWIEPRTVYHMNDRYALGYASNNNNKSYESYKILRIPHDHYNKVEIFELKSNSWRVLDSTPHNKNLHKYEKGMSSLKGNAYWILGFSFEFRILSFDFTTERFRLSCFRFPCINTTALSVVREEKLTVLHRNFGTKQMEIWLSDKIDDTETVFSWSKSFTLALCSKFDHSLYFPMSFLIDEEKKLFVSCGRNGENKKNMIHIVAEHGGCTTFDFDAEQSNHCWPFLFSYVPSLVSLNPPM